MVKKILIILILFLALGYGLYRFWISATHVEWGHHFRFENNLGIEIDSLSIIVGDTSTLIQSVYDSSRTLEGNIKVPDGGYPHKVELLIYSNENLLKMEADSFDCYNCDGSHLYILNKAGAEYKFEN